MNDKQFNDAFTAAGGWFIAAYYEKITDFLGDNQSLIEEINKDGMDSKLSGTSTRVSSTKRIIDNNRSIEALVKIRDSQSIARLHPESSNIAKRILKERFSTK